MNVRYNQTLVKGQPLTTKRTQNKPTVRLVASPRYQTLVMWDPDVPTNSWLHWLVVNIPNGVVEHGTELVSYAPPTPPPGTGIHRYHFTVFEQSKLLPIIRAPERKNFYLDQFARNAGLFPPHSQTLFTVASPM